MDLILTDQLFGILFLSGIGMAIVMPISLFLWSRKRKRTLREKHYDIILIDQTYPLILSISPYSFFLALLLPVLMIIGGFSFLGALVDFFGWDEPIDG